MNQFFSKPDNGRTSKETVLQDLLEELTDKQIPPQQRVRIVLSKAMWMDIPKHDAIQAVLASSVARHFQDNPHLLLQLWGEVWGALQPSQEVS